MSEESCEGFEIAIEMRRHVAEDAEVSRRLDEHLRSCPRCRAYEALGTESEAGLRSDAEDARAKADLERLRARGRRIVGGVWSDAGAFFLLMSLASLTRVIFGPPGVDPVLTIILAALFLIQPVLDSRRSRRELEEAWSSETLFYAIRRDLKQRLLASSLMGACTVALVSLLLVDRLLGSGLFPAGALRLAFAAAFGALGVFVLGVRVPRLLREFRETPRVPDPHQVSSESFFGLP